MNYLVLSGEKPRYQKAGSEHIPVIRNGIHENFYRMFMRPNQRGIAIRLGALVHEYVERVVVYQIEPGGKRKDRRIPTSIESHPLFPQPNSIQTGPFLAALDFWTICTGHSFASFDALRLQCQAMSEFNVGEGLISPEILPYVDIFETELVRQGVIKY